LDCLIVQISKESVSCHCVGIYNTTPAYFGLARSGNYCIFDGEVDLGAHRQYVKRQTTHTKDVVVCARKTYAVGAKITGP